MNTKYSTYFDEVKKSRSDVLNVLKLVLDKNIVDDFTQSLVSKKGENLGNLNDFIEIQQDEFLKSLESLKEANQLTEFTKKYVVNLCDQIKEYNQSVKSKQAEKEALLAKRTSLLTEIKSNKVSTVLFAYLNKAKAQIEDNQFDSAIQLLKSCKTKYLPYFHESTCIYTQADRLILELKSKIVKNLQLGLNTWLRNITHDQTNIGKLIYEKAKMDRKAVRGTGRNMLENIRKTQNMSMQKNKTSLLKNSLLRKSDENFDIISLINVVDLSFLSSCFETSNAIDGSSKVIDFFVNSRKEEASLLAHKTTVDKSFFSDILGFITVQLSILEVLSVITKQKFEETILLLVQESVSTVGVFV